MTAPALLPGIAFLLGVVVGLHAGEAGAFGDRVAAGLALTALLGGWIGYARRRGVVGAAGALLATALAGSGIAANAARDAAHPPVGDLFEHHASVPVEIGPTSMRNAARAWDTVITGRLRRDARPLDTGGVLLDIDVERAVTAGRPATARGGVTVTVSGGLAGAAAPAWRAGRRVRLPVTLREPGQPRNPGAGDRRRDLRRRGVALVGSVKSAALVEVTTRGSAGAEMAAAARAWVRHVIRRHVGAWSARSAAIVTAVLAGDRAGLDADVERRLQEAGTYHIIAISGGNIAILAGLVLGGLSACGVGRSSSRLITIAVLAGYAALVGREPSVVRATLMAIVYLASGLADLRAAAANSLGVAAVAALAASPLSAIDTGFALTFVATAGIIVVAGRTASTLPSREPWRALATLLVSSIAAEAALLPIGAAAFSRVTFAGLLLNFLAIPLMTVVQAAGLAVLATAWWPAAAATAAGAAHLAADLIVDSATLVDLAPWLSRRVPPAPTWILGAYYASLAVLFVSTGRRHRRSPASRAVTIAAASAAVACVAWILWNPVRAPGVRGRLTVTWLDVGQGDATVVVSPTGATMVVDAGGSRLPGAADVGARVVSPALWALGVRRVEVLAITHGDVDHVGGAPAVASDFRPRLFWEGLVVADHAPTDEVRTRIVARGGRAEGLRAGQRRLWGGLEIDVLHPPESDWERQHPRNDDSLVLDLRLGGVSVLLTGDIGADAERAILGRLRPTPLRVIKVPHHGSASSSTEAFLRAARPAAAVLSAGRGGWLGRDLLERYRRHGIPLVRTDEDGAVTLSTDGRTIEIVTATGRRLQIQPRGDVRLSPGAPRGSPAARARPRAARAPPESHRPPQSRRSAS